MTRELRWQWRLANGALIEAIIDPTLATESVFQANPSGTTPKMLSQGPRGDKPDGHQVVAEPDRKRRGGDEASDSERPAIEASVTFEPKNPICILRVDGHEVAPVTWPTRDAANERATQRNKAEASASRPMGSYIAGGFFIVVLLVLGIFLIARRPDASLPSTDLTTTYRSPSGLFVAHYPSDFNLRPAVLPTQASGIILEDKSRAHVIVIGAMPMEAIEGAPSDPWVIQQHLHPEALVNVPKNDGKYEETARRDESCLNERGAVVVGTITQTSGDRSRVWSCTFTHQSATYIAMYVIAEPTTAADENRLLKIINATELTRLADLGEAPR